MATKSVPIDYIYTSPVTYVDVYTSKSANPVTLTPTNSGLKTLTTQKYIRGENVPGKFIMELAPGGINGVNDPITWTTLLPQYSLCVVYAGRGNSRSILMIGLISSITETQIWTKEKVERGVRIEGLDFTLFFTTFAYYVLRYLGLINTLPALFGPAGTAILNAGGEITNEPSKLGATWFTDVVVGPISTTPPTSGIITHAVLDATTVPYKGAEVSLKNIFTYWFEPYTDLVNTPVIIPVLSNWLIDEGTLWDKFIAIFPHPFYEFFINTVPSGYYTGEIPPQVSVETTIPNFGKADIVTVARVNPVPCLDIDSSGTNVVRSDKWNALDLYSFTNSFFIESNVKYDIESIKNFFVIEPMGPITAPGGNISGSLAPSITQMGFMYDPDSIAKYGFRPEIERIMWWVDPLNLTTATVATSSGLTTVLPSVAQYESFLLKVSSYYAPIPNMLSGMVRIPMWPEVVVGNRFEYAPFKNGILYTFYVTGVEHNFRFGSNSDTVLYIERGLPSSIYADNPSGLLKAILSGQVTRVNGTYTITGKGLVYKQITEIDPTTFNPAAMSFGGIGSTPPGIPGFPLPGKGAGNYDALFQASAVNTVCGTFPTYDPHYLDWRVLKAVGVAESGLVNGLRSPINKNGTYDYGIMQINTVNGGAALQYDAVGNINAAAQILCANLQATGDIRDALARYNGWSSYGSVGSHLYVDPIIQVAMNAGVSIV